MKHSTKGILALLSCGLVVTACAAQSSFYTAEPPPSPSSEISPAPPSISAAAPSSSSASRAEATVERIDLASPEYSGTVGDTFSITAAVHPTTMGDVVLTYTSTDEAVVTVDQTGFCLLTGAGTAEVTVTHEESGAQTQMSITATAAPAQAEPQTPPPAQAPTQQAPAAQAHAAQTPQAPAQQHKPQTPKPAGGGKGDVAGDNITNEADERQHWSDVTDGLADNPAEWAEASRDDVRDFYSKYN